MQTEKLYQLFRESSGLSTDSRKVAPGQLFFALWGEKFNGNTFASEALDRGASWAVIDDPAFETDRTILVDDCLTELQKLATYHRKEINAPVIAITGTNGKTTTKDLISKVLSRKFKVHSTSGNLNNHIGVPLTILSAPTGTEIMVIEMGANHIGEIRSLCLISQPDYGIITNTGFAHIEGFGSFEGVVKAKSELFEYLRKTNGIAIYNDQDPILTEKIYRLVNRAVPYSYPTGIFLKAEPELTELNLSINVTFQKKTRRIKTNIFGLHNFDNVRAAIATGLFMGVSLDEIAEGIEKYRPENNRSQVKITKNNTLVCDSYNANPTSMKLVLESFSAVKSDKKLCILGDMLELGEKSEEEHLKVIKILKDCNLSDVILAGPIFTRVGSGSGFKSFHDVAKLKEYLRKEHIKGFHILVKGSRGMALEQIYNLL
jgi:UDP-N-acetylmuramoyl-tripeptide--D-alanyl-D-alanine ligase